MKEITKAENDDGRVEGVVEVAILRGAEVEEEQLQFIHLQIAILLCYYLDQFLRLVEVRHFLYPHEQTCLLYLSRKPHLCRPWPIEFIQ